jgi:hypothetical protein
MNCKRGGFTSEAGIPYKRMTDRLSKLLVPDDKPVITCFELARDIGLEKAVIVQQMHYFLLNKANGKVIPGRKGRWLYNTYGQWHQLFPWMSMMTLRRRFRELEQGEWIQSCQPERRVSRRKYYQLLVGSTAPKHIAGGAQNDRKQQIKKNAS